MAWHKKEPDLAEEFGLGLVRTRREALYIPLEHFFVVASHFMPAFSQAAWVFGMPAANAGAATATIRLKATIDTKVFMDFLLRLELLRNSTFTNAGIGFLVPWVLPNVANAPEEARPLTLGKEAGLCQPEKADRRHKGSPTIQPAIRIRCSWRRLQPASFFV